MTIYTVIFGNYDTLKEPTVITPGWRYVCFTDQDFKSNTWEIVKTFPNKDVVKTARLYKITAFKLFEGYSIYIDGSFRINCDLNKWKRSYSGDFVTIKHPWCNCAFQEAENVLKAGKSQPYLIQKQLEAYKVAGLEPENGMIASGILMRNPTEKVIEFCEAWWKQVEKYSERDQLAFAFTDFLYPNSHVSIDYEYIDRKEFLFTRHNAKLQSA